MERIDRCELLARLPDRDLTELVALVVDTEHDEIITITPPTVGMIMARVQDGARGDVFNLGEVLVTECQVQIGEREGWSMLMGNRPRGAFDAAAIDAVTSGEHPNVATLDARLTALIAQQDEITAGERAALAATRVQFDTQ